LSVPFVYTIFSSTILPSHPYNLLLNRAAKRSAIKCSKQGYLSSTVWRQKVHRQKIYDKGVTTKSSRQKVRAKGLTAPGWNRSRIDERNLSHPSGEKICIFNWNRSL